MARKAHKLVHGLTCPYGAFNWADCDKAAEHQWGPCQAVVGKHEPEPCSRWAADDKGYCGQHYVAKVEGERAAERIAIAKAEMDQRIDAYIEWSKEHPSVWDSQLAPRGVAAGAGLEPATSRVTADRSTTELPRKGPYKVVVEPEGLEPSSLVSPEPEGLSAASRTNRPHRIS